MSQQVQQDALEIELIRSLFETRSPAAIMSAGFVLAGSLIAWGTRDPILAVLLVAGALASIGRLFVVCRHHREAAAPGLPIARARLIQRRFAISYFGFAMVLGMFGYRTMQLSFPKIDMLMICMLVGYGAGVAASTELRPRIAIPSMLVAIVPALNAALSQPDPFYWATALLSSGFLIGGVASIRRRHGRAVTSISRRLAFSTLARQDDLTALPNRLALREWFDARVTSTEHPDAIAVHYLDLDGFKPVNDCFGHAVGDALLIAVGKRILGTIRENDTAARLGGDEFAVIQCGISSAEEADLLAKRLAAAIARPYRIDRQTVRITSCVGYVLAEHGAEDLECLLSLADEALYASKRGGGGITRWQPYLDDSGLEAAA